MLSMTVAVTCTLAVYWETLCVLPVSTIQSSSASAGKAAERLNGGHYSSYKKVVNRRAATG